MKTIALLFASVLACAAQNLPQMATGTWRFGIAYNYSPTPAWSATLQVVSDPGTQILAPVTTGDRKSVV